MSNQQQQKQKKKKEKPIANYDKGINKDKVKLIHLQTSDAIILLCAHSLSLFCSADTEIQGLVWNILLPKGHGRK